LNKIKSVFIIGGTGLLGYHASKEFLEKGIAVSTISLHGDKPGDWYPKDVNILYGDVFSMSSTDLKNMLMGFDALVYAAGPDDRFIPPAPAYKFFYERLVLACERVVLAAKDSGVQICTILNSYFAYFHRIYPDWKLAENHSYIKCRIEQADRAIAAGGDKMTVSVLELPYIFGVMPERESLWYRMLFERMRKMPIIMFPKGGTTIITVKQAAEAICGAILRGEHGKKYPVAGENMNWPELLRIIIDSMGYEKRRIITIPTIFATWYAKAESRRNKKKGLESGLNHSKLMKDIQSRELFVSRDIGTYAELQVSYGGVKEAIIETVKHSYPKL
jgi:dihydroflavonol-4-reductase